MRDAVPPRGETHYRDEAGTGRRNRPRRAEEGQQGPHRRWPQEARRPAPRRPDQPHHPGPHQADCNGRRHRRGQHRPPRQLIAPRSQAGRRRITRDGGFWVASPRAPSGPTSPLGSRPWCGPTLFTGRTSQPGPARPGPPAASPCTPWSATRPLRPAASSTTPL